MPTCGLAVAAAGLALAVLEGEAQSRCSTSGAPGHRGESEPPSFWAKLDWFCVSWSAVPSLPPAVRAGGVRRLCSLATAVAWLDEVAASRDADGAAGGDVAVQVGEERVLRHVDDHRGPEPDAPAGVAAASASEFTVNDPLASIVRPPGGIQRRACPSRRWAVVWSLAITIAMPPPTPRSPAAPFCPQVMIDCGELAVTVTLPAFVRAAPSWISDSCRR